jgi:hypothetical protein
VPPLAYKTDGLIKKESLKANDDWLMTNSGILSISFLKKKQSEASPPPCKPMKPTGWKRARRDCSAYASESDIHKSSIFNLQF